MALAAKKSAFASDAVKKSIVYSTVHENVLRTIKTYCNHPEIFKQER